MPAGTARKVSRAFKRQTGCSCDDRKIHVRFAPISTIRFEIRRLTRIPKKYKMADRRIRMINGRIDGQVSDLAANEKLCVSHVEVHRVNVANRIAAAEARVDPATGATEPVAG
jgi:hypothetical protein